MDNIDIFSGDYKVSVYNGVRDTTGVVVTLATFLTDTKHRKEIEEARLIADKEQRNIIKKRMPQAVIGGTCYPTRSAENTTPNGLICVDIDAGDNPNISDWQSLKEQLSIIPEIAYISLSFSANGLFLIVPLENPQKFTEHFKQLEDDFSAMGLNIDHACSDVCRMRCMSYDTHPYINHAARTYKRLYKPQQRPLRQVQHYSNSEDDTLSKVAQLVQQITETETNITSNYDDWIKAGQALSSLGEEGRELYHAISAIDGRYRERETDNKFNSFLRLTHSVGIGTFFHLCQEYGIIAQNKPINAEVGQLPIKAEKSPQKPSEKPVEIPTTNTEDAEDSECVFVPVVGTNGEATSGTVRVKVKDIPQEIKDNPKATLFAMIDWDVTPAVVRTFATISAH
jgi:hypothetical protein